MSKEREALKQIAGFTLSQFMGPHDMALACVDIARKVLAQPEQGPVAYQDIAEKCRLETLPAKGTLLHTIPPQRTWVGLTDEEREELMDTYDVASTDYAQAIEAKLKEKNT